MHNIPNTDNLMDPAEGLKDHEPGVFHELLETGYEEEIVGKHRLALVQLATGRVKVKVHV